ncbi:hypothetical protein ABZ330_21685 [Streptomyces sp. NPDC006172]|uniref:hypothetical protein n=1 Tax=Streptomyces sp. NPDC006172 TaxID=3154470 RepID=UPI0033E21FB1
MIRIIRAATLAALHTETETVRAEAEQNLKAAAVAAEETARANADLAELRAELARAEGELASLRAQLFLDAEDRVALRMLLRTARRQAGALDRVYVLFRLGQLHSIHASQDSAEAAAEAEGAARHGWTTNAPGAAMPPASEVQWRVQPLPLGTI